LAEFVRQLENEKQRIIGSRALKTCKAGSALGGPEGPCYQYDLRGSTDSDEGIDAKLRVWVRKNGEGLIAAGYTQRLIP